MADPARDGAPRFERAEREWQVLDVSRRWLRLGVLAAALVGLLGCAAASGSGEDVASLRQQVSAQGTRIAALETRVSLPQQAAAPTAKPAPTATIVPSVAGLAIDGATKGASTAKVTITEYLDYL